MLVQEQINLYIADLPEWQRKVLVRVRQLIHSTDEDVQESWHWHCPHFDHQGIMIGMAGHKTHVSVSFHKGALLKDTYGVFEKGEEKGNRVMKLGEGEALDEKSFVDLLKQAIKLNVGGVKLSDAKPARKSLEVPEDLDHCLHKDEEALEHWENFSYTYKKEYVEWITDAKKEETRKRRIAQALEMIREGVGKEDKYRVK